jgi:phage terminase small subunit
LTTPSLELSDREISFVSGLANGLPVTTAAKFAGYSASHAANLLRKPMVQAALRTLSVHLIAVVAKLDSWKAAA